MKKRKGMKKGIVFALGCLLCTLSVHTMALDVKAGTAQNDTSNPYVSTFACPDGTVAWTIVEDLPKEEIRPYQDYTATNTKPSFWGSRNDYVYFRDAKINDVILEDGQHFYKAEIGGVVELAGWKMNHVEGRCIHQSTIITNWHGFNFAETKVGEVNKNCYYAYPSGWFPVCADCGEAVSTAHVYATKAALQTIDKYDTASPYYYICPNEQCRGLENSGDVHHECKFVSWNKYRVVYDKNSTGVTGVVADTYHMYDHHTEYEGYEVDPVTTLANNGFKKFGYTVTGWNTKADGSGTFYPLGYEIPVGKSLTTEQYDRKTGKGTVTLYAVWQKTESTLNIDPNGGSYDGKKEILSITKGYGYDVLIEKDKFTAPSGYTTKFDPNGGSACGDSKQTMHFDRIERKNADTFAGKLNKVGEDYKYEFLGQNQAIDTVVAKYEGDPITLPNPTKPGYSFGGWYKDKALTEFVGGGGDAYTPDTDRTLYASWAKLTLEAVENYVANNKKGASDLTWMDENHSGKYYQILRSLDGINFAEMLDAADGFSLGTANKTLSYTGGLQTYTVQATGLYTIEVAGAQGGAYGTYIGGKGGKAVGKFYLKKGSILQVKVGGVTYGGGSGGSGASAGAKGGGATSVTLNGEILLVAGGGGGATDGDNGKDGGATDGLRAANYSAATMSGQNASGSGGGGGGGYIGGKSGEKIVHTHTESCEVYHKHDESCYEIVEHTHSCASCSGLNVAQRAAKGAHRASCGCTHSVNIFCQAAGAGERWCWGGYCNGNCKLGVRGADGIYRGGQCNGNINGVTGCNYADGYYGATPSVRRLKCDKIYAEGSKGYHVGYSCGYEANEVLGAKGAYGGSNYVADKSIVKEVSSGVRSGNGYATIKPSAFGVASELSLNGVPSPDKEAPEKIDISTVVIKPISSVKASLSFQMPADKGTDYYWRVKSYYLVSDAPCATSNIARDVLITGIAGYRYVYDTTPSHGEDYIASLNSGYSFLSAPEHRNDGGAPVLRPTLDVNRYNYAAYLHIAPVDVAGNVGKCIDITFEEGSQPWTVVTADMKVSDTIGGTKLGTVYTEGDIHYVRADGSGLFKLSYDAFLDTPAKAEYQIDYQLIAVNKNTAGKAQEFTTKIPYSNLEALVKVSPSTFERFVSGDSILNDSCNTGLSRLNHARQNQFFQCFTIPAAYDGQLIVVTPIAGVTDGRGEVVYSKWEDDLLHAAKIMPDAKAPVVSGLEFFEGKASVNREEPGFPDMVTVTAVDALSGVASLTVNIVNQSNGLEQTFLPGADGKIILPMGASSELFEGDLTITVTATDHVGNRYIKVYGTEVFKLHSKIVNAYDNTTNICKRGGAALLGIVTEGYAEMVEIELHDKVKPGNEGIQTKWIYTLPSFANLETVIFQIPADCPDGVYSVTVKAVKNGGASVLYDYPDLVVAGDTPVGEVRARIR